MQITRRTLLAGSGLVLVACSVQDTEVDTARSEQPGQPESAPAQQTELALIALYTAVRAGHPELDTALADIQSQHEAHLIALGGTMREMELPPVASTPNGALEQCILAETQAANAQQAACMDADTSAARTLALISASEASHVPALRRLQ